NLNGSNIVFNTGNLGSFAIRLSGSVSITADPTNGAAAPVIPSIAPTTPSFAEPISTTPHVVAHTPEMTAFVSAPSITGSNHVVLPPPATIHSSEAPSSAGNELAIQFISESGSAGILPAPTVLANLLAITHPYGFGLTKSDATIFDGGEQYGIQSI